MISNFYLPGFKSGGGTRTIVNTVDRLSGEYEFFVVTRGYDAGEADNPYPGIEHGKWNSVGNCRVLYLEQDSDITKVLPEVINEVRPSALYANSFFSDLTYKALWLRRLRKIPDLPFVIAPCGELSEGALAQKSVKKQIFIKTSAVAGLWDGLIWKASSDDEARELEKLRVKRKALMVAPDLPPRAIFEEFSPKKRRPKAKGRVRLVFLSRFDRKKNLKWLLENVKIRGGSVELDVFGNIDDQAYFDDFMELANSGSHGFSVTYRGTVEHEMVPTVLADYDFFVLPTLGENFGHVFLESLSAGCPLITTEKVPWGDVVDKGAGWCIPLQDVDGWNEVLRKSIEMGEKEHGSMVINARGYAEEYLSSSELERATVELLEFASDPS